MIQGVPLAFCAAQSPTEASHCKKPPFSLAPAETIQPVFVLNTRRRQKGLSCPFDAFSEIKLPNVCYFPQERDTHPDAGKQQPEVRKPWPLAAGRALVQGLREFLLFSSILNPRDLLLLYLGASWGSLFLGINASLVHEYL